MKCWNASEIWRYINQQNPSQCFLDVRLLFSWQCSDIIRQKLSPDISFLKVKLNRVLLVSRVNWVMWHYSSAYTVTLNWLCMPKKGPVWELASPQPGVQISVWDLGQISRFQHSNALLSDMREINFKIDKRMPNELRDKQQSITSFYLQFCTSWSLDGQASKCGGRTIGSLGCG